MNRIVLFAVFLLVSPFVSAQAVSIEEGCQQEAQIKTQQFGSDSVDWYRACIARHDVPKNNINYYSINSLCHETAVREGLSNQEKEKYFFSCTRDLRERGHTDLDVQRLVVREMREHGMSRQEQQEYMKYAQRRLAEDRRRFREPQ